LCGKDPNLYQQTPWYNDLPTIGSPRYFFWGRSSAEIWPPTFVLLFPATTFTPPQQATLRGHFLTTAPEACVNREHDVDNAWHGIGIGILDMGVNFYLPWAHWSSRSNFAGKDMTTFLPAFV
jgi:hypothetical protein